MNIEKKSSELAEIATDSQETQMNRRSFLIASAQLGAGLLLSSSVFASSFKPQTLSFYHTHTGKTLEIEYSPEKYTTSTRWELESFLRDFRTGEVHPIDPRLLDTLCRIQSCCDGMGTFEVISGYRSPRTNEYLRQNGPGVAKKSWHMKGRAIDVRLAGRSTKFIRDIATKLHNGGVGYYPQSDFIHIDTGKKRAW